MRIVLIAALAAAAALAPMGSAFAQQRPANPSAAQRINPNDPAINRPPPMPPGRPSVGPPPSTAPPMQRITPVAPLSQPPMR